MASLLSNLDAVTKAFSSENWPITKERLKEIEHVKRQRFNGSEGMTVGFHETESEEHARESSER